MREKLKNARQKIKKFLDWWDGGPDYQYNPDAPGEKIADFCEHLIAGLVIGLFIGTVLAFILVIKCQV